MGEYNIPVSKYFEARMYITGKVIHIGCYLIGWFMPFYFAGSLESGNVCEYFKMIHYTDYKYSIIQFSLRSIVR
jgi:hypothetical protein